MHEQIMEALAALAGCVCEELDSEEMCFCGITLGDQYIALSGIGDCVDECGEAWVRIVDIYPSSGGGEPDLLNQNCSLGLGLNIEIGVLRCIEFPDDGESPTAEALLAAADQQMKDMDAIRRAALCCETEHFDDKMLTDWGPIGPSGGLVGGTWSMTVLVT